MGDSRHRCLRSEAGGRPVTRFVARFGMLLGIRAMRDATRFAGNVIGLTSIPREEHAIELQGPGRPVRNKSGSHSWQRSLSGMLRLTIALRGTA
jgi:hypothetical protein